MQVLTQLLLSGIAVGMIYAVIAFGYQLTFATSKTLNFGQGEALAIGALIGLSVASITGYWIMLPLVLAAGALQGAIVERLAVRPAIQSKSESGWIMATIALGLIFRNLAENIWGRDDLKFPSPLPEESIPFLGARILPMEIAIVLGAIAMMLAVEAFNRYSIFGKAVVATSNDRDAAGLMGINTSQVITFSYALSSMAAALAVGFAVSVAQYLPTQFIGAGRHATVTTEAVTLASGGQRHAAAAFALLHALLPLAGFALAAAVALRTGHRTIADDGPRTA